MADGMERRNLEREDRRPGPSEPVPGVVNEQQAQPELERPVRERGRRVEDNPQCGVVSRNVMILPVENGFIVEIGCKRFVGQDWEQVSAGLELYFRDPKAAEEKYCKSK